MAESFYLKEDGSGHYEMEDGNGALLLESSGAATLATRAPLFFQPLAKKIPDQDAFQPLAALTPVVVPSAPAQNVYLDGPPLKKWASPDPQQLIPDLIPIVIGNRYDHLPIKRGFSSTPATVTPDVISNLPPNLYESGTPPKRFSSDARQIIPDTIAIASFNYEYPAPKVRTVPQDAPYYNVALLTPTAVSPQPQPLLDYPALPKRYPPDDFSPNNGAIQPFIDQPLLTVDYPARKITWPGDGFTFPNIASITFIPPPSGPTPAGRHHKRYKVFLDGRAVYFATRAEAEKARDSHRERVILTAKAAGADPRTIKVRRARITQVTTDGRHPEALRPAQQMARVLAPDNAILQALNEARMREEEEIAIALLML